MALIASGCTGGDSEAAAPTSEPASTTTTAPPALLGLTVDLDLLPEQCWSDIPEAPTTTTTTTTTTTEGEAPTSTADGPPEPLPATSTTVAAPEVVAEVDCAGTHDGKAFAVFCLGAIDDPSAPEDPQETTTTLSNDVNLTEVPCPAEGQTANLEWPGDRLIRRAAARVCLERFEAYFNESYALSALVAREFTPTEGVWERGERRVVCTVDALEEPVPSPTVVTE